MNNNFPTHPLQFWQDLFPPGTFDETPSQGHRDFFPVALPDGRQIVLPIRPIDEGRSALASLIVNQASFAVLDALSENLAAILRQGTPDIVVGLPTLGLTLAAETARKLGHHRYVALSTSRKFWYQEELSVPLTSITSPGQIKRLYLDPRMAPLLSGKRVVLIDDVISSGKSILAGLDLLYRCDIEPVVIGTAMLQTTRWRAKLGAVNPQLPDIVQTVFSTPLLKPSSDGHWTRD